MQTHHILPFFTKVVMVVLLAVVAGCGSPVKWERDLEDGLERAVVTRNRALVQFYSPMSAECRQMDDEVFADPEVQNLLGRFVLIRVDTSLNKSYADQFNVVVLPTFVVFRPTNEGMAVVGQRAGKMDSDDFRMFLIKNSLY